MQRGVLAGELHLFSLLKTQRPHFLFLSLGRLKRTLCPGLVTAHASVSPRALDLCTCTSGAAWRVRGRRAHLAQQGMDESSLWAACSQDGSARVDTVGLGVMEGKPAS